MDVDAYMAERIGLVDAAIEAHLSRAGEIPTALRGAMRHLLFPGGKRLRPIFSIASAEAIGSPPERALPMCVAVELIHTYSLVHDDLPCMDDDDERRGRPTVHVAYDEATAVLAGDALLTAAFGALAEIGSDAIGDDHIRNGQERDEATGAAARARIQAIGCLARAAGAAGLVGGQIDDLAYEASCEQTAQDARVGTRSARLSSIHARKTGALFRAAVVGGAVLGRATQNDCDVLDAFASDIGSAFQIADDLLDAGKDEAASILRLQGVAEARADAEALLVRALERIEGFGDRAEPLRELARFAVRRDR